MCEIYASKTLGSRVLRRSTMWLRICPQMALKHPLDVIPTSTINACEASEAWSDGEFLGGVKKPIGADSPACEFKCEFDITHAPFSKPLHPVAYVSHPNIICAANEDR